MRPESSVPFLPRRNTLVVGGAVVVLTGLLSIVPLPRQVDAATTISYSVPPASGQLLASNCFQCHGTNGQNGSISALAGAAPTDFFNKMKDQQTHDSIMGAQARGYSDAEIRAMGQYFSGIPKV